MPGIATLDTVVLDCPDPRALAEFYGALLGWPITDAAEEWVTISDGAGRSLSFQRVADHRPPRWPDPAHPQQAHLDFTVPDIDAAEPEVLRLGAVRHEHQPAGPGGGFRVYLDPAGHPFCLCRA